MTTTLKLTKAQTALLSRASLAEDGFVDDAPEQGRAADALIQHGMMLRVPRTEGGTRLLLTQEGRAATTQPAGGASEPPPVAPAADAQPPAEGGRSPPVTKIGKVVECLRRPEGATIEQLMAATGWQTHSVRGALSGAIKKGLGLTVTSEKTEAERIYRVVDPAARS